ncbi:hypothetical protein AYO44_04090 [Planctomycetaceae bacterium SCGC AG-212-F19]|nr:hypothetical protein AYO44_04090 [Planctomycetaceae bacterium SCGC AG-212-F19]
MVLLRTCTVALLGNPNTGKTTLFNALAGMSQRVGNYPGVTVETKKGRMSWQDQPFELIDLPGTYSLAPRSPDEMVAVDLILGHQEGASRPDVVLSIVDASNLERNLYLTSQVLEMGVPVVIALNMIDVAQVHGIKIDTDKLGKQLGVRVVPIQANKGRGLDELRRAVAAAAGTDPVIGTDAPAQGHSDAANGHGEAVTAAPRLSGFPAPLRFPDAFEREVEALRSVLGADIEPFVVRRLLLDVGGYVQSRMESLHPELRTLIEKARQRLHEAGCPVPAVEARTRYAWIREATAGCVQRPNERPVTMTDRLDRILTHWFFGSVIFLVVMLLVFQSIFTWANPVMEFVNAGKDLLAGWLRDVLPIGPLTSLLVDGIVKGVGAVIVFLPQILILFAFIAILEDCGYMARAAYLMDRLMARAGLSGKSFIPMLSSVACAVPGIMATRVIENRRDRLATILVAPLMSCSARLPVYILLIGAFLPGSIYGRWVPGLTMFAMYMIGIVLAPLIAWALKRTLLRGETPVFVMEMPLYKVPSLRTVLRRMLDAGWAFTRRAGTLILASMVVVWALLYFPGGVGYEQQIAALDEKVKAERDEVKELKDGIAPQTKELEKLDEQAEEGTLTPEQQARKQELAAAVDPVKEKMKPLQDKIDPVDEQINQLKGEWKGQSILGRLGHAIEPAVMPLGWDWRIGTAALASFPAREVVVGTLGIIYNLGEVDSGEIKEAKDAGATPLGKELQKATWESGPKKGQKVFTVPVALSLMVFFALCCQCASTLAVIRRETASWGWPIFTFVYMTVLAYIGALIVYQVGTWLS